MLKCGANKRTNGISSNMGSDAELRAAVDALGNQGANPEDPDEYLAENFILVPRAAP
jgi:hypothetical protein